MQHIVNLNGHSIDPFTIDFPEAIEILKSLRSQKQWKPTEEQMTALNLLLLKGKITEIWQAPYLQSLYKDLEHYSYER